ncbi:MAG: ribonuclease E/G [Myxococcales bacterium]|nr:ribonuclease E/G [Myxococcales bacterium]
MPAHYGVSCLRLGVVMAEWSHARYRASPNRGEQGGRLTPSACTPNAPDPHRDRATTRDSAVEHDRLVQFLDTFMPACRPLLAPLDGAPPISTRDGVEHDISRALERKGRPKSGGSIVIDQTEALPTGR